MIELLRILNKTFDFLFEQVSVPATGQLALDFMCGEYPAARCSANKWFNFMGDASGVYVPFQINYVQHADTSPTPDGYTPLNPKTYACSSSLSVRRD